MSAGPAVVYGGAELRARSEIEGSPDVYFVLCKDKDRPTVHGTLYAVLLPQDAERFRVWDDRDGFDVLFKLRGRWRRVSAVWRQLKGRDLDPAENSPVGIATFGRKILKRHGAKEWKPKK